MKKKSLLQTKKKLNYRGIYEEKRFFNISTNYDYFYITYIII